MNTYINTNKTNTNNIGFQVLHNLFQENGWHAIVNEPTRVCFTKSGDETTTFDMKVTANTIVVSVPIQNSRYQFTTSFANYYAATEYVEQRFHDYLLQRP